MIQSLVESLFGHEKVSDALWNIAYQLIIIGVLLVFTGGWAILFWDTSYWYWYAAITLVGCVSSAAGLFMIETCQKNIPANPANIGLLTIWGKRLPIIVPEGDKMYFKYWPLKIDYILVNISKQDIDFIFDPVLCGASPDELCEPGKNTDRTGGKVSVKVSLTVIPTIIEPERIIHYLNYNGIEGVKNVLSDVLGEAVRNTAIKYDWESFLKLKKPLTVMLLERIADIHFRKLPAGSDGLIPPDILKISVDDYKQLPEVVDPLAYLFPDSNAVKDGNLELDKQKEQEIDVFLRIAQENDVADVMDLGITIKRLNVPKIDPDAALSQSADGASVELKEREKERRDNETDISLANAIVQASKGADEKVTISFDRAYEMIMVKKGHIKKISVDSSGSNIVDAAALFGNK